MFYFCISLCLIFVFPCIQVLYFGGAASGAQDKQFFYILYFFMFFLYFVFPYVLFLYLYFGGTASGAQW